MGVKTAAHRWWASIVSTCFLAAAFAVPAPAQDLTGVRGMDPDVDYASMVQIGPWDDRNLLLTKEDLAILAENESELRDPIPVFFRVELRKANPGMLRKGNAQYPRSALQIFKIRYGGYLFEGRLYPEARMSDGRFHLVTKKSFTQAEFEANSDLTGDVRITSPTGAAESAIKISPVDINRMVAGSNGPGSGQIMWHSSNGGATWTQSSALPLGSTCCDPTVDWSSDGTKVYTSTLGGCGSLCNIWVYRSGDFGATWNDLGADPRRELTSANTSDKQYIHVDRFPTSPRKDNLYVCWHDNNTLKFSRSTDFAQTFSANLTMSSGTTQSGIGCDISSDKNGNVYYVWPATNGKTILVRKSTDGGATFASAVTIANTQDGYDFAIPAMETRRAFIYASTDVDLSSGPFANSIYVAWTDTTAPENTTTPSSNHGRIQIAYSRDGGATWTIRTPHSTADANTVDRFHPWIGVGPDGLVYVMFYDTRNSPTRVGVDVYYSVSSDGGNTWAAPTRMSGVTSPQIDDSFEWGDYNGMDVMGSQLISIYTDNRNESGGSADSIDVYASGATVGSSCTTPPVPTGVSASAAGQTQVNVSWTASAGATSYNVSRSTTSGGPYTLVGTSSTTSFSNTGLTCNTAYHYVVQAVNSTCVSANSAQASATTSACTTCTPPSAPPTASATGGANSVTVSWPSVIGATEYHVLRSTTSGGPYTQVGTTTTPGFTNTGLACGTTYFYVVRSATSATCESGNSPQASAATNACSGNQVLTFSATPAAAIPDNNTTGTTSTINVAASQTITSVSVNVGITHTFQGDLEVALIGPDNTTVLLHNRTGGGTDNINTTYNITTRSSQALTAFNGKNTAGAWKLRVRDLASADTGTLNSWKVTFNGYQTLTANTAIPDNNTTGITSTINVPATGNVVSLRVRVDITHTFQGDLEVALIGPDNTTVLLHNRTGSGTDNIRTVYADLTAPAQALSAFNGKAINGAWKLRVRDLASADTGTLVFWEIDFRTN